MTQSDFLLFLATGLFTITAAYLNLRSPGSMFLKRATFFLMLEGLFLMVIILMFKYIQYTEIFSHWWTP